MSLQSEVRVLQETPHRRSEILSAVSKLKVLHELHINVINLELIAFDK